MKVTYHCTLLKEIIIIYPCVCMFTSLVTVSLETGIEGTSGTAVGYIEQCTCPAGYTGLSCESCDFGYARIVPDSSDAKQYAICSKCNCHGHAATCHPITGQCGVSKTRTKSFHLKIKIRNGVGE